jgi:hypothetical protein
MKWRMPGCTGGATFQLLYCASTAVPLRNPFTIKCFNDKDEFKCPKPHTGLYVIGEERFDEKYVANLEMLTAFA